MALVLAGLSESQWETVMKLIFQRGLELTALNVDQLREFLVALFHAPKSSLENASWSHKSKARSFIAIAYGELEQYEGHWAQDEESLPGTLSQEGWQVQRKREEGQVERLTVICWQGDFSRRRRKSRRRGSRGCAVSGQEKEEETSASKEKGQVTAGKLSST